MQPNRYTELFFLDEATALAAGHRPCFECRRRDAEHFAALWGADARLAGAGPCARDGRGAARRACRRPRAGKITYRAQLAALPDGTFVRLLDGDTAQPYLVDEQSAFALEPGRLRRAAAAPRSGARWRC